MKILFCTESFPDASRRLRALLPETEIIACPQQAVAQYLNGVDVVIPAGTNIDAELVERGRFGLVQQFGVGLETVDLEAAHRAGVWVARIPSAGTGNADSVAEHAVLLMLALSRRLPQARQALDSRRFGQPEGLALSGKTACIIGLGDIGRGVALRLRAFGMRLVAVRRRPNLGAPPELGAIQVYGPQDLTNALSRADYVVLCVKYEARNHHLLNRTTLAALKPGAFLINVARGGLVDPEALLSALESGQLAGAGLDVFWEEPVDPQHPLFRHNVIATPHIGGVTDLSYMGIAKGVAENIQRYARGEAPLYAVNTPEQPRRSPGLG